MQNLSLQEKIDVFCSLFKGRDDVFARRWYSKTSGKAGLISQLRDSTGGIQGRGKVDKVYLDNSTLIFVLGNENTEIGTIRETFFFNQMRVEYDITSSPISDFLIADKYTFEVGARRKNRNRYKMRLKAMLSKTISKQAMATSSLSGNLD